MSEGKSFAMKFEAEAIDIPTMRDMSIEAYRDHLNGGLFFVDHHDVLRAGPGEFPLAVTREQFRELRSYLERFVDRIGAEMDQ